jgi:hypothetical protein
MLRPAIKRKTVNWNSKRWHPLASGLFLVNAKGSGLELLKKSPRRPTPFWTILTSRQLQRDAAGIFLMSAKHDENFDVKWQNPSS